MTTITSYTLMFAFVFLYGHDYGARGGIDVRAFVAKTFQTEKECQDYLQSTLNLDLKSDPTRYICAPVLVGRTR